LVVPVNGWCLAATGRSVLVLEDFLAGTEDLLAASRYSA
jgi:hypothetical protein